MLKKCFNNLFAKYVAVCKESKNSSLTVSEEWFYDNFYIIEREYQNIEKSFRGLKRKNIRFADKKPIMLAEAARLLEKTGYKTDREVCMNFLSEYTSENKITCEEVWLFPDFLKVAIIIELSEKSKDLGKVSGEVIGNLITSLISVSDIEKDEEFDELCPIDNILFKGHYSHTTETKSHFRSEVVRISVKYNIDEETIAQAAVSCAQKSSDDVKKYPCYFLTDEGKIELFHYLGIVKKSRFNNKSLYRYMIIIRTIFWLAVAYYLTRSIYGIILGVIPALEIAIQSTNYIFTKIVRPVILPAYDLKGVVPPEGKCALVYPVLLASEKDVYEMGRKLESCYVNNGHQNISYVLLGDLKDANKEKLDDDERIKGLAEETITRLNEKYDGGFFYFTRSRKFNKYQNKWMVWERKRGALTEFCRYLRGKDSFEQICGNTKELEGVKYIITLDKDTVIPADFISEIVGSALHPLNVPRIDKKTKTVTKGYGIIKPSVFIDAAALKGTMFEKIFGGLGGVDPYSASASDLYMDVFGEAVFTGKGLINVDAFLECTNKAIPENTVLSHDLLEGSYLRCALYSPAVVYDSFPETFESHSKRQHRWIRGDWQLLPWIFKYIKDANGKKIKNPLNSLSVWKITDNLRRSITPLFLTMIIIFSGILFQNHLSYFAGAVLICVYMPALLYISDRIIDGNIFKLPEKFQSGAICGLREKIYNSTLSGAFLAYRGFMAADAIVRTIGRVITKKNTLEWVTAAQADSKSKSKLLSYYSFMSSSVICSVATVLVSFIGGGVYVMVALVFAAIWIVAPAIAYSISKRDIKDIEGGERERIFLRETAERTWNFFEDTVTARDNFLPPDNLQLSPYKGIAHRTSPTNIGLYLMSVVGARDMGFINTEEMEERIGKTLDTVEALEKWRGHLLNWYDTRNLKPLRPAYVSTVDSGNFICYMMTAAEGIREYGGRNSESLVCRINKITENTSFLELFDESKKLFSIGYNIDDNRLSASFYDMLAGEARQTVFLAVAKGEVEKKVWFKLSRALGGADCFKGLLSWTGTMFEYLMPLIIMKSYPNTLLDESYSFAVYCQRRYGRKKRTPWGVSESGFYGFDMDLNYQYKAYGVPDLAVKKGNPAETVVAPYATMLALMVNSKYSFFNLLALKKEGAYGKYGFYEAVDYSEERLQGKRKNAIVKSYMAHHQGMSFCSIVNLFTNFSMQERFMAYPQVRGSQYLLCEKLPYGIPVVKDIRERITPVKIKFKGSRDWVINCSQHKGVLPKIHILSNGNYNILINENGYGTSALGEVTLGKQRRDPKASYGNLIYIKNEDGKVLNPYDGECIFSSFEASYTKREDHLETSLHVCVIPDFGAEIRRLTLVNKSDRELTFEVTAHTDLALSRGKSELSHTAFSKLFIKTEYRDGVLYAERKARDEGDSDIFAFCKAYAEGDTIGEIGYDTDRENFPGRGKTAQTAIEGNIAPLLNGRTGSIVDSCFTLRVNLKIAKGESASVAFLYGMAEDHDEIKRAINFANSKQSTAELFSDAYRYEKEHIKPDDLLEGEEELFLNLLPQLYYGAMPSEKQKEALAKMRSKRELWKFGISGDYPIVTLILTDVSDVQTASVYKRAQDYYRHKGIRTELIIICHEAYGYSSPLYEAVKETARHGGEGVFVFGGVDLPQEDEALLVGASSLLIIGEKIIPPDVSGKILPDNSSVMQRNDREPEQNLMLSNGYGGFTEDGKEYVIKIQNKGGTPAPWINVIANEKFGFTAGESGGGYTWYKNSREMKISAWNNDFVEDPVSEKLTITEDGMDWGISAGCDMRQGKYFTRHGIGYTIYERFGETDGGETVFVPENDSVKIIRVMLKNNTKKQKAFKVSYSFNPIMGVNSDETRGRIESKITEDAIITKNLTAVEGWVAFLYGEAYLIKSRDTDRVLTHGMGEDVDVIASYDFKLEGGESKEVTFILGGAESEEESKQLIEKYKNCTDEVFVKMQKFREQFYPQKVKTQNKSVDLLCNYWLLYQLTSSRLWGRTAFYQSGGAFGYRDQLQDSLALLQSTPNACKEQIIRCAAHQFYEGDVLHWWHEDTPERGVRTRFSDDRLWLPYATAEYIRVTGDKSILDIEVPYLISRPLEKDENERYEEIGERGQSEILYCHLLKAIAISLETGIHGIPKMGGGDWNDGMNSVGILGKGESVWLAWFLITILEDMVPICRERNDEATAKLYEDTTAQLKDSANSNAWDGNWFIRAFYDDGRPIGSHINKECVIDSISQSWAVISGGCDEKRRNTALESAMTMLVDEKNRIVKLLTPPFTGIEGDPGYIKSYSPGIRENGGQYTHGAIWLGIAQAMVGNCNEAFNLFEILNPVSHSSNQISAGIYKAEPYVVSADVYAAEGSEGRGGWSWYTGAAGWMYRFITEYLLGIKKQCDTLTVSPCLPSNFGSYSFSYKYFETLYDVNVSFGDNKTDNRIKLVNDKVTHNIDIII